MLYLAIDVAKDKHDCRILDSDARVLAPTFSISNSREGFDELFSKIESFEKNQNNIKAGLEATGHYSYKLLSEASRGRCGRYMAILIRDAARASIGSTMAAKSMELIHTIGLIETLSDSIDEVEKAIKDILDKISSPLLSIPGIKHRMGVMILAEIGDFCRFDNADQILAYAGMSPSTYQSVQLISSHSRMEK